MKITDSDVRQFQALYHRYFKVSSSKDDVTARLTLLVRQLVIIYQPISKQQFDTHMQRIAGGQHRLRWYIIFNVHTSHKTCARCFYFPTVRAAWYRKIALRYGLCEQPSRPLDWILKPQIILQFRFNLWQGKA